VTALIPVPTATKTVVFMLCDERIESGPALKGSAPPSPPSCGIKALTDPMLVHAIPPKNALAG
jgi:hypothetical protein